MAPFDSTEMVMLKFLSALLVAAFALLPAAPADASWAIAIAKGHNPIVTGNDNTSIDQGASAVQQCNQTYSTSNCRVIAKGNRSCVALANNGAPGTRINWTAGQGAIKSVADTAALQSCTALHAGSCKVVHDFCR